MITEEQLREKLKAWIREYGDGGMPQEKTWNIIQALIDHKGFVPSSRGYVGIPLQTVGDEVEHAVNAMAAMPAMPGEPNVCFKAAMALRAYYLTPLRWPEEERIRWLGLIGLRMSRHTYYRSVQLGRAFLMGFLASKEELREESSCVAT